jgi:glycosyltransferase involved in cell wall biosynthesis
VIRIGIDALGIHYYGGGRTATLNLLEGMFAIDRTNEYHVFLSQPEPSLDTGAGNVFQHIAPVKDRFLVRIWAQAVIPAASRGYDLVHFSKNLGVFGVRAPTIITIYDLTTLVHPEIFPAVDVWYWKTLQRRTLARAVKVVAISHNTAQDILQQYGLPEEKVEVIYPAISDRFKPAASGSIEIIREKYNLPEEYIIHVGRIDEKKNLTLLVEAFHDLLQVIRRPVTLVLVGGVYPKLKDTRLVPKIHELGIQHEIIFTGQVPDSDLPALYSGALATVFPSIHEGFGLAPLEAMACGSPVIGSRAGAFQEAAGEAAYILDEMARDSLCSALQTVIQNPQLRQELRQKGLARSAEFRKEKAAAQTLALYRKVVE